MSRSSGRDTKAASRFKIGAGIHMCQRAELGLRHLGLWHHERQLGQLLGCLLRVAGSILHEELKSCLTLLPCTNQAPTINTLATTAAQSASILEMRCMQSLNTSILCKQVGSKSEPSGPGFQAAFLRQMSVCSSAAEISRSNPPGAAMAP